MKERAWRTASGLEMSQHATVRHNPMLFVSFDLSNEMPSFAYSLIGKKRGFLHDFLSLYGNTINPISRPCCCFLSQKTEERPFFFFFQYTCCLSSVVQAWGVKGSSLHEAITPPDSDPTNQLFTSRVVWSHSPWDNKIALETPLLGTFLPSEWRRKDFFLFSYFDPFAQNENAIFIRHLCPCFHSFL